VQKDTKFSKSIKNIVFPVSTTAEVRQKIKWTTLIAKTFKSKIHIFQLNQPNIEDQKKMRTINKKITDAFDEYKLQYVHVLAEKRVSFLNQLLDYGSSQHADLIVIMTTPGKLEFKLGAYDEKMIFNPYNIPVMCVNPVQPNTLHWY
jgi:predicted protein tyrosine phosphatase